MKSYELNLLQLEKVASALGDLLPKVTLELKGYFASQATLLLNDEFLNVLPGLLNNTDSASAVENSLYMMKSWA